MSQNIDKNKLRESIQKSKQQNLLYLTINSTEKDSKKKAIAEIEKFVDKKNAEIIVIRSD
jgi:Asp/Glu/hydantoin racemase